MKILLIFTLFLISVGGGESERVMGYSGGVLINCRYERRYTSNPKYLCKGPWSTCADQIKTGVKNKWINSGRFSLFDDTRAAQFWVMIRELTVEDSGTYQCGVDISLDFDILTPVELKVEEDTFFEKSITESAVVGGSVNISCKYPQSHSSYPKFLCRRVGTVNCSYETSVKESRRWRNEGKLYLHDDGKQIFTVVINRLTEGDSGEYWCGAESDWTSDHGYKVYITQINLTVTERKQATTASSSRKPSQSMEETTFSTPKTMGRSLFKAKATTDPQNFPWSPSCISSQTTNPTTSSSSKSTLASSSATAFPVSSVITGVSVIVVLLLIGLLFLILTLRRRGKTEVPASSQSRSITGSSSNHEAPAVPDYEEIIDFPVSDAGVSIVYSTAQLPTNPSEPSQTVDVQLPSSCDFSNPIYSTVQLPPNSPDQVICSTAQLPTIPSDFSASAIRHSAGTSAEGPTYATVNFSRKASRSTDTVTRATINKIDTVKHES
ncbi:polymeric immunoglobulin receptor-like [Pygocentrus nattereri]|uniref:polymeric immunoglobulin receptor-like n=1 Tax=Pygocentrus nattereri TaxID=42514 RepID=UPI0018919F0A|nr:polymeric immunoglobulin receptor-like [Pygocentrus nattereri]